MRKVLFSLLTGLCLYAQSQTQPPIYIAFLWHMHQPIYYPYESVVATHQNNRYPFSVWDIFTQRYGPYTNWPKDAVQMGINANLPNFGAQVSFSGSLIENLNNWEQAGYGYQNWKSHWNYIKNQQTSLGNPRLDMVGFGYHHPLMGLLEYDDIRTQIQLHKNIMAAQFTGAYSKGIFPPENAFNVNMIPALVDEGIEWALVDNIHFDRACTGYPFSTNGNMVEMNIADQINPNPNDWVSLNGVWAPTQNSALWGRQPHYVQYTDPNSGIVKKMIAVPADRYLGNEDGRGGFGALDYNAVMSQLESYNTDPSHPMLIVLHHDGDNYGGGSASYYQGNFQAFVNWLQSNSTRFKCTTIQDYLEMFPPDPNDVIHVEPGSWAGADNGDPEFKKWNADPDNCVSPDRNSWGVITATKNYVKTAKQIAPNNSNVIQAEKLLMNAQASDYWYWDGSLNGIWDSHPTRACNQAMQLIQPIVAGAQDATAPTIWAPQREHYNPGEKEWTLTKASDFTVWTFVHDVSGLQSVTLKYRTDNDGINPLNSQQNETYAGGNQVSTWNSVNMTQIYVAPGATNPLPLLKASQYEASILNLSGVLIDYYIEATDIHGNISKSPVEHSWIGVSNTMTNGWTNCDTSITGPGGGTGGSGNPTVMWLPSNPGPNDTIEIIVNNATQGAKLHWGVNTWQQPNAVYHPAGSALYNGGPAVQSPMQGPANNQLRIKIGPCNNPAQSISKIDFVINYNDNTWDNNGGGDYHINIGSSGGSIPNGVSWTPVNPTKNDVITIYVGGATQGAKLHWGVNSWQQANNAYWPSGSYAFGATGPATQSPMQGPLNNVLTLQVGPFNNPSQTVNLLDFVINYNDNTWDNNNSADYHINISQTSTEILTAFNAKVSLYPNPANEQLNIQFSNFEEIQGDIELTFLNILGQNVKKITLTNPGNEISLEDLPQGIYSLILDNHGKRTSFQLVVIR